MSEDGVMRVLANGAEKRYIKKGGSKCPVCGSTNVEGDSFEADGGEVWQEVGCAQCGAQWMDYYRLFAVRVIGMPEK